MTSTSLYLDFDFGGAPAETARDVLTAALEAAPISSMLLRTAPGVAVDIQTARALLASAQKNGVAALVTPEIGGIEKLGADGIHLPWSENVVRESKSFRQSSPQAIVGADAGRSRHDAMEIGEAGADYVAFGIPPHVEDRAKAGERQRDLIAWWSELFEVPCVAFDVPDAEAAHRLAAAGADFVCLRVSGAQSEKEAATRVREFSEALRIPEPAK